MSEEQAIAEGNNSDQLLRSYAERVDRLESERADINDSIKDIFTEAESNGFDKKVLKKVIKLRRETQAQIEEELTLTGIYLEKLGVQLSLFG